MDDISIDSLKRALRGGEELALLDLREEGAFAKEHLLLARCFPLSRVELIAGSLLLRRSVPIVVMDGGDGRLASEGAARLVELGYSDVSLLSGGLAAWRDAGYEVFSGVNVPSKAFGEFVEITYGTPRLPAEEVKAMADAGADMVILDSRPFDEFNSMNIPGGIDTPGAELVHRVADLVPNPETTVVVNCAGRTRSIIGCQSLLNAGIPNPVYALKDGTMGWHLAGFDLERGQDRVAPTPSVEAVETAQERAAQVAERFGVRTIDRATLARWQAEAEHRSLYLLDVRAPEEFLAGHLPGSVSAPGGQLVQATDEYVAVLNARLVLIDDNGVRAKMTASWLQQMGWRDAVVLEGGLTGALETGPAQRRLPGIPEQLQAASVSLSAFQTARESAKPLTIDLASSLAFREGHIPGAVWASRASLPDVSGQNVVLTGDDLDLCRFAAADLLRSDAAAQVRVLEGGNAAWRAAGLPLESGGPAEADPQDVWYKPYDEVSSIEDHMRAYLTWEVALVEQMERDPDLVFKRYD